MKDYIEERVIDVAVYLINTKSTTRQVAERFGVSKSTVHTDVSERLPKLSKTLAMQVREVLEENIEARSVRGGLSRQKQHREKRAAEAAK